MIKTWEIQKVQSRARNQSLNTQQAFKNWWTANQWQEMAWITHQTTAWNFKWANWTSKHSLTHSINHSSHQPWVVIKCSCLENFLWNNKFLKLHHQKTNELKIIAKIQLKIVQQLETQTLTNWTKYFRIKNRV